MHASQPFLDLLYIARNDWIGNQVSKLMGAINLIKTFRPKINTELSIGEQNQALLNYKSNLSKVLNTPIPSFAERYQTPQSHENLMIKSSITQILDDPQCQEFIQHVEGELRKISEIIIDCNRPESNLDFMDAADTIETICKNIQKYTREATENISEATTALPSEIEEQIVSTSDREIPLNFLHEKHGS